MLWLSENDLKNFFGEVIRNVAKSLEIRDWEWLFHSERLEQIKAQNSAVATKLNSFFTAYENWHAFHVRIDQEDRAGALSPAESNELHELISARNSARESLVEELHK